VIRAWSSGSLVLTDLIGQSNVTCSQLVTGVKIIQIL
jgi:hypothetical protein